MEIKEKLNTDKITRQGNKGFTLIEMIASLLLFGLLLGIAGLCIVNGMKAYSFAKTANITSTTGEAIVLRISKAIINMNHDKNIENGSWTKEDSLTIKRIGNLDSFNEKGIITETYKFDKNAKKLLLVLNNNSFTLAENLDYFKFRYFASDGTKWTKDKAVSDLAEIGMEFSINGSYEFSSKFVPRNIYDPSKAFISSSQNISNHSPSICFIETLNL